MRLAAPVTDLENEEARPHGVPLRFSGACENRCRAARCAVARPDHLPAGEVGAARRAGGWGGVGSSYCLLAPSGSAYATPAHLPFGGDGGMRRGQGGTPPSRRATCGARAFDGERGLLDRLRQRRMGVAGAGDVLGGGPELHRHRDLVDQVAGLPARRYGRGARDRSLMAKDLDDRPWSSGSPWRGLGREGELAVTL